jgi:VanZ family protein
VIAKALHIVPHCFPSVGSGGLERGLRRSLWGSLVFRPNKAKGILRLVWLLAILTVIVGSVLPSDSRPMQALDSLHISDKIEHIAAYAALTFLPALHERRRFVIAAAIGAVALGVALEYVQLYSGWRNFEVADMIADAIGACSGLVAGVGARSVMAARL